MAASERKEAEDFFSLVLQTQVQFPFSWQMLLMPLDEKAVLMFPPTQYDDEMDDPSQVIDRVLSDIPQRQPAFRLQ